MEKKLDPVKVKVTAVEIESCSVQPNEPAAWNADTRRGIGLKTLPKRKRGRIHVRSCLRSHRSSAAWPTWHFRRAVPGRGLVLVIVLAVLLVVVLVWQAWLAIRTTGLSFFTTSKWDPEPTHREFGAAGLRLRHGRHVGHRHADRRPPRRRHGGFLAEIAPAWLRRVGSFLVEMLAAIPSVVYGFWGLFVFRPAFQGRYQRPGRPGPGRHRACCRPA